MKLLKPGWVHHDGKPIFSVDVHKDGQKFATGGQGSDSTGRVVIWNLQPVLSEKDEKDENVPKIFCQMDQHLGCVNCVRWSQSGQLLASGSDDKLIMIWRKTKGSSGVFGTGGLQKNYENWKCFHTLRGHAGDVLDLAWSPDDQYLASCSIDNTVIIWYTHLFPIVTTLRGHTRLVKGVTWDPVGKFLASQSDDRSVRIWKTSDWSCSAVITEPFQDCGGTTHVLRLSWSPDGQYLVTAHAMNGDGPTAQIIERKGWKCKYDFVGHRKAITCVRFHNSILKRAVNEGANESPANTPGGTNNVKQKNRKNRTKTVNYCCLAMGSRDRSLSVWMTSLQRPLVVIHELFEDSVLDLSWSAQQCLLIACSGDGSVACLQFCEDKLGANLSEDDTNSVISRLYGKGHGLVNNINANAIIENPNLLGIVEERPKAPTLGNESVPAAPPAATSNGIVEHRGEMQLPSPQLSVQSKPVPSAISQQTETRTKDGRRRITPMFIPLHEQEAAPVHRPAPVQSENSVHAPLIVPKSATVEAVAIGANNNNNISSSNNNNNNDNNSTNNNHNKMATVSALPEPQLSKEEQSLLDSRLNVLTQSRRRQPIQFDNNNLDNFPRQLTKPVQRKSLEHQGTTSGPKMTITPNTKCEFVKAALDFRIHIQNGHMKTTYGMLSKITGSLKAQQLWEIFVGSPVVNANLCTKYAMLCLLDGSMRLVDMETGSAVFPTISLTSTAVHCAFSPDNNLVGVLTECGLLRVWDIRKGCAVLSASCSELLVKQGSAVQFAVTDKAMPLIGFPTGNAFSYSARLESWLVLSNKDAIMYNGMRGTLPRDAPHANVRLFPLLSMQINTHNYISLTGALELNAEGWQHSAKILFIENQIKLCQALESLDELRHWYVMLAFHLASNGTEKRLRLMLDDLLYGPEDAQQHIPKHELLELVLDTIKPHVRWQRLYTEYVELLKFAGSENEEIPLICPPTPPQLSAPDFIVTQIHNMLPSIPLSTSPPALLPPPPPAPAVSTGSSSLAHKSQATGELMKMDEDVVFC